MLHKINMNINKMDNITIRIPESEKQEFKKSCEKSGAKMSSVLKIFIQDYTEKNK